MSGLAQPWELWVAGFEDPEDDNTDVIATLEDGSRFVATFFTYKNIERLRTKNTTTGECLSGKYFWASDMILVDRLEIGRFNEVIRDMIEDGSFESAFQRIPSAQDEDE